MSYLIRVFRYLSLLLIVTWVTQVYAQPILQVSSPAWQGLTQSEKDFIQNKFIVEAIAANTFGVIIDNQGVDRSTPGTTAGSNLGQAIGSAAYIDKAFGDGNYSAMTHLGAMIMGGVLGSALDKEHQTKFQFRYAIRLGSGDIIYQDIISNDPFRHPVGICVIVPTLIVAETQHICTQTTELLRNAHIPAKISGKIVHDDIPESTPENKVRETISSSSASTTVDELISCKSNNLAPIRTSAHKCNLINGVIIDD